MDDSAQAETPAVSRHTSAEAPYRGSLAEMLTQRRRRRKDYLQIIAVILSLYFFIAAINLIGHGLKSVAKEPRNNAKLQKIFDYANTPMAGLCIGILLTGLVQSSSFTTSFAVTLVAAGQLQLVAAVPIIMGANIGTSITNILVSLGHMRRRLEFQRALAGAIVHDFFNFLTVLLIMPLEIAFGILSGPAQVFADWLGGAAFITTDAHKFAVIKMAIKPLLNAMDWLLINCFGLAVTHAGIIEAIIAIALLFTALICMVKMLQGLIKDRLSGLFNRTFFRNQGISFGVGIVSTALVQSSSVATSLTVPLVGAGVLSIRQIYPYTLGANIGTTVTAMLAALSAAALAAGAGQEVQLAAAGGLALALTHLLFNIYGTSVFWPLQWIPISLAQGYAKLAARRRTLAVAYILIIFFILPVLVLVVTALL